ncbi:hypothetical protein [Microbacterium sp. 2FI]|uniref:hypothetical protein n=1 Tax=Microbacterium sp. 2FI TaxID=2502193 RepID=UPI0010F67B87|nr:hypothetical protein [Microbacterium sp. 2FI]
MAREAAGLRGGSAALLELIEEHRPEFTFDFRRYFGVSVNEVGWSIPYGEAWLLILELRRESGSHTHMLRHGFTETASLADFAAIRHAEWFMNSHKKDKAPLIELPHIWEPPDPNADVTPERRAELEAQLERRSAFADR